MFVSDKTPGGRMRSWRAAFTEFAMLLFRQTPAPSCIAASFASDVMRVASRAITLVAGVLLISASGCASLPIEEAAETATVLITGGLIVDPASDAPLVRGDILIVGDRIERISPSIRPPRAARVIDASGRYVMPGLWDMHGHLAAVGPIGSRPEGYVGHGVLAVRDMGGHLDQLQSLKSQIAAGRTGPTLVLAGPTLNGEAFGDFHRVIATEAEGRAAVRDLAAQGVDLIKVHRAISPSVFTAVLDEARMAGLPVGGHVPLGLRWSAAAAAGMYSIEHAQTIIENEITDPRSIPEIIAAITRLEGAYGDALFQAMAERGTYFDPTLAFYVASIEAAPPALAAQRRLLYARLQTMVGRASRAGVPLLAGSDALDRAGAVLWDDLDELVKAGLTPRQALQAATTTASMAARRPELGRLVAGGPASLLIVDGDPTVDVRNVRRLDTVVLRGRVIDREVLRELRDAEAPAAGPAHD